MQTFLGILMLWGLLCLPSWVRADAPLHSYALVVGSNRGGAGQATLSFAERDAERMADLLVELGRTPRERVTVLRQPSTRELELALSELEQTLAKHAAQGEPSQVVFYYSGHARARALSLGQEEVPLDRLRKALTALPSTLTVVVLDACQSGAFSGVKGASPAADFSLRSVNDLHSQGIAVMASSTATEFSQESPELGSSYFSHHLMAALRGAGDGNSDGRVSLDEAYTYAYQHTLSDTARTQVGTQHATLETDLRGRGDVPLSYPVDADAQLTLQETLDARVIVQRAPRGAVIAEIVKVPGLPLHLALPSGRYEVLVRGAGGHDTRACEVTLTRGSVYALNPSQCPVITPPSGVAKNGGSVDPEQEASGERRHIRGEEARRWYECWFLELGVALGSVTDGAYTRTLEQFRFSEQDADRLTLEGAAGIALHPNVNLVARYDQLESRSYERSLQGPDGRSRDETFAFRTHAVSLGARGRLPLKKEWVVAFAEGDLGLGRSRSEMEGKRLHAIDHHFGLVLRAAVGLTIGISKHFGLYAQGGYVYAPVTRNAIGEAHNDGGVTVATGIRLRILKGVW